jgi:phosphatidylglycerol:prolipoprotein diacylglycerol transferase
VHPVLIAVGRFKVYSWGFMLALAVIAAVFGMSRIFRREGYDPDDALDMVIVLVLAGLLGSRLAYIAMYEWQDFLAHPGIIFRLSDGGFSGLVWYGGLTAGLLAAVIFIWKKHLSFWKLADICSPYLALGYAMVRVGCFLNGCCYGKVTGSPLGVVFPGLDGLSRYPTQLFSSAVNLLLFLFLLWYYPRRRFSGQIFLLYIILYSLYRFGIEFLRENWVFVGPLSISQFYSLVIIIPAIVLYFWKSRRPDDSRFRIH